MGYLFYEKRKLPIITMSLSNISKSEELTGNTICSIMEHMAEHGQNHRKLNFKHRCNFSAAGCL